MDIKLRYSAADKLKSTAGNWAIAITPHHKSTLSVGRRFDGLKKHLKSKVISRKTKLLMYKTFVRPILAHASETFVLFEADERSLSLIERRVVRCSFRAVQDKDTRRKRDNYALYELFHEPDITKYVKID